MKKKSDTELKTQHLPNFWKKVVMVKFILVFMLAFCYQSYANKGMAQKTVTLQATNQPLIQILKQMESQTKTTFIYNDELLRSHTIRELNLNKAPVFEALKQILKEFDLAPRQVDNDRILINRSVQQSHVIQGRIINQNGDPLAFVTVMEVNTNNHTQTDANGYFKLSVSSEKAKITVKYIGYETLLLTIDSEYNRNLTKDNKFKFVINMVPQDNVLDSVIVHIQTGYQHIPKERSAGAFSQVRSDQILEKSGSMNVVDRLEGLVPGLAVNYGEGNDKLLLRGVSSVNLARQPLIVLDGVPIAEYTDIESLVNAQDVKDITVLKDATAASIWGAQAANGVIVITTQTGEFNSEKVKIAYDGMVSLKGKPDHNYLNLMDSRSFTNTTAQLMRDPSYIAAFPETNIHNVDYPVLYPHEQAFYQYKANQISESAYQTKLDSLSQQQGQRQVQDLFYRNSVWTNHNVTLSGGGSNNRFFASLGYLRNDNYDKTKRDRYNITLKEDIKIGNYVRLDLTGNMAYELYDANNFTSPKSLDDYLPYVMFVGSDGQALDHSYLYMTDSYRQTAISNSGLPLAYRPYSEWQDRENSFNKLSSRFNAGLSIKISDALSLNSRGQYQSNGSAGYDYLSGDRYQTQLERIQFTQLAPDPGSKPTYFLPVQGGNYTTLNDDVRSWTVRSQLDYNKTIAQNHQITALAGFESRSSLFKIKKTYQKGYDLQSMTYTQFDVKTLNKPGINNTVLPVLYRSSGQNTLDYKPLMESESELRFVSFYSNIAYSYRNKYNFNGSLRFDQSNLFGKSSASQNKPIWSMGVSWNAHKEDFFQSDIVNNLTLRTTYGIAGNSPRPGLGGPFDILYAVNDPLFDGLGTGYIVISPANNDLVWEQTRTFNLAVDYALWNNRIRGSIDFYSKNTSNLFGDRPIDNTLGWVSAYGNLGDLYNRGVEIQIESQNIRNSAFRWSTNFNIAYNKNKITALKRYNTISPMQKAASSFTEGYSAFSLFGLRYSGLNNDGNPEVYKANGDKATMTNQLTLDDVHYQGSSQPLWYGGITNRFDYKNFNLSFLVVYNLGHHMRQELNTFFSGRISSNLNQVFEERWQQPGDEQHTIIPKYIANQTDSDNQRNTSLYKYADVNIISASYLRLRDLTLSYTWDTELSKKYHFKDIKVFGQVNNILLWTKNSKHIDPEYYNLASGYRVGKFPPFFTLGLRVNL
ncbi:SusC/RagA family TonB-linked outer membrane protein [Sphingobacterium faecale]|uniref:SusC/RagA family TonB-linked outer membrane protein n=1 Tax=Sphingobacterium faecale TaxID=2803775 RepID=A0ABS1R689_9SPHI|nr:SusC/RagA family TonB-linked outer membrane protein [Sphingobacterium faecale]MBL1409810.1 SusC/RagA family TonB-linked outer membrane protein [Sphingobacterium faecale]